MGSKFNYFLEIIPPDMYSRTKATICQHIAIFEPEEYVLGEVMCVDDYHFLLFFASAPITRVNNVEYRLKKSVMLVIQPWERIYGVPGKAKNYGKYLHIAVRKDFFQKISTEVAGGKDFEFKRVHGQYSNQLLDLIGNFQQEMMNYGEAYPQMLLSLSTQIVFQLIRDLSADHLEGNENPGKDNPYIREAIRLMQQYYATSISINDISNLIYLSPCHFKRVFKEHTGQTPHRYLMGIRLEKAKELLERSDYSIEDTARLCGFVNAGHFAVAFKRSTKLSPSEYRKMHVQNKIKIEFHTVHRFGEQYFLCNRHGAKRQHFFEKNR
ncbi:AraC family transcriptional regulator [Pseudoclostridium thermosuccinogenes]|jgi:AraC-like DNA-binding protein|uniref:AraC family transcriptional regulator n=1 Tax=Clostridium thermosuccinogenes TaxID=84032 RepID=UPI002FDA487B